MNIKLKKFHKIKLVNSSDIYSVMERIYKRESKADRNKEHLWTISLDNVCRILNIELVSLGTVNATMVSPAEVYSIPLQKKAVSVVLIHNHPTGELRPSEKDQDVTDRLIQCGLMMGITVADHIILTEKSYYSFGDTGLLEELSKSTKYTPTFFLTEKHEKQMRKAMIEGKKEGAKNKVEQIVRKALKDNIPEIIISQLTGLSEEEIAALKSSGNPPSETRTKK